MLLPIMLFGYFLEVIGNLLMLPLVPFVQLGAIGKLIGGEIKDVFENGK